MAVETNLTVDFVKAQSIDFVEQYGKQLNSLFTMLQLQRKTPMPAGAKIQTYKSSVTLDGTKVEKGDVIPLSKVKMTPGDPIELTFDKKRKAVAVEDVQKYGFDRAIAMTDDLLLRELQKDLRKKFFAQLAKGTGKAEGVGLQGAVAQAWGAVQTAFEDDAVSAIAFANPQDLADYLANAQVSMQTAFGLNYIENFLGVRVMALSSLVPKGKIYATDADNLCFAYAQVTGGSEVGKAFDFTTDSTGVIGVTRNINKERLTAETVTFSGTALYAERLDGVIVVTVKAPSASGVGA